MENSLYGPYDTSNDKTVFLRKATDNQYSNDVRLGAMLNLTFQPRDSRHRYEFNTKFREQFEAEGFVFSGVSPDNRLMEVVELPDKKFFVAAQYHPEYHSRPNHAEELYTAFVTAAVENAK